MNLKDVQLDFGFSSCVLSGETVGLDQLHSVFLGHTHVEDTLVIPEDVHHDIFIQSTSDTDLPLLLAWLMIAARVSEKYLKSRFCFSTCIPRILLRNLLISL